MYQDRGSRSQPEHRHEGHDGYTEAPPPETTLRDGNLKAVIWRNPGERGDYFPTTFARTYRDDDGTLRDTDSFVGADLLRLSELARGAYAHTTALRREAFAEHRKSTPDNGHNGGQRRDSRRVR